MPPELTNDEINLLCWAFAKNQHFSKWLVDKSKVRIDTWINYSDVLIDISKFPIQGIQDKLAEIGSESKLLPTLSELRAAKELAKRNFEVELLLDNDKRFKGKRSKHGKPPDLSISREKSKIWVEVMRKFGDDIDFSLLHQKLTPLLEERDFALSIFYSEELSELAVDYPDRKKKEKIVNDFVEELQQRLNSLEQDKLPHTFNLNNSEISVELAEPGWGGIYFGATFLTMIPIEKFVRQVEEAVRKKASKRKSWKKAYLSQPFLVFLDLGSMELYQVVYRALYGSGKHMDWLKPDEFGPQRVIYPEFVTDKLKGNQQELLLRLGFDSRRHVYIDKPGIFVTEECVRKNISGVVIMFNGKVECFPNPFCDEEICFSKLPESLDIPLTSFAVGGSGQST